jgi:hypothetical protein
LLKTTQRCLENWRTILSDNSINYTPAPTVKAFIKHYKPAENFADWIIGPVGSGKTVGNFFKLVYMATLQEPWADGKKHVRAVVVRNTMPQLVDTTISSWMQWFQDGRAGKWEATKKNFTLRFGDVEVEVLFRALDTEDDIARVLSLETTFVIIDEFVQIPQKIVQALSARCGRWKSPEGKSPTNWGMWGSSNPDTEDNWWYEALQKAEQADGTVTELRKQATNESVAKGSALEESSWTYFKQPSGLADGAENIDNLPGGIKYYTSLMKDNTDAWIQQFVYAEWGYSTAGLPVIRSFRPELHVAKGPIAFRPGLKLVAGYDPGMSSAMIFGQFDSFGRLSVLDELITEGYGTQRLISDKIRPLLKSRFPGADFLISPDPAAGQRAQKDERTVVDEIKKHYTVKIPTQNNQLPGRITAIEHFTTRITEDGAALQIDPRCVQLIRALRAGWRYNIPNKGDPKEVPLKNKASHPADAFSYLCQYGHLDDERTAKRKTRGTLPTFNNPYAIR